MDIFIYTVSYLKYLSLFGVIGIITGQTFLQYFGLFVFAAFFEILLTLRTSLQSIYGLVSCLYLEKKYKNCLPSIESYEQSNTYSLPFEGKWTVFNGGTSVVNSHSWDVIPQRYAYDFIITDSTNNSFKDNGKTNSNYYCFEQNILAPADGIVISVFDECADNKILPFGLINRYINDIRGNYVVIKHSGDEFSVLAHLRQGSMNVVKGQFVKHGDVIAKCGNSGRSSEPHLHFQVQKGSNFFSSIGLPVKFSNFSVCKQEVTTGYIEKGMAVNNLANTVALKNKRRCL